MISARRNRKVVIGMEFVEVNPLPEVCQVCAERLACISAGEGEWCCDECDHLGERFVPAPPELST